jgi:murein DD-endopeptidase MepM/ murein hydrolase activator NlpD
MALVLALAAIAPSATHAQRTYTVRPGDTLARIARRYHTTITAIREANGLHSDAVRDGQELFVPRAGEATETTPSAATARSQRAARARADRLGLGRARAGRSLLVHAPDRRWIVAAGAPRGLTGTLLMPVAGGAMIRGWGSGPGGYHLAMDIRGRVGQPIRACERGIVAYAGNEISGYGNFVMIVHPNGLVTAYAHNRDMLVTAGQVVARGDRVSTLGNSGLSHGPHLHFMVIHDGEHCDPAPLFRPHIGPRTPEARWRRGRAPAGVHCLPRSARPHPGYRHGQRISEDDDGEVEEGDDDGTPDDSPAEETVEVDPAD